MDSHSICPRCLWGGSSKDSGQLWPLDRKSTRLNSSHILISYAVFCLKKKMFRGIAAGLTRGIENYLGFSARFLFLTHGYVGGTVPTQLCVLIAVIAGFWSWLHVSIYA